MSNNNSNSNNNQEKEAEGFDHPLEYYLVPTLDDKKLAAADKLREFYAKTQCSWCGFPLQGSKFFQMHKIKGGKEKDKYCSLPCVNAIIEKTGGNSIGRLMTTAKAYNAPMVESSEDFKPLVRLNSNGLKFAPGEKHVTYAEFFKARLPVPKTEVEKQKDEEKPKRNVNFNKECCENCFTKYSAANYERTEITCCNYEDPDCLRRNKTEKEPQVKMEDAQPGKLVDPKRKREEPAPEDNNNKQAKVEEEEAEEKFIKCEQGECKNNAIGYYSQADYVNHYFCKECKPMIPKDKNTDVTTTYGSDRIPESRREKNVIRCQWTVGCKNPCVNWDYKEEPGTMRGVKRRFYCKDCHQP